MSSVKIPVLTALALAVVSACSSDSDYANQPPPEEEQETIWDLFSSNDDPDRTVNVNRYLWNASLEVLSFLPIQSIDPFSGVISTDWGRVQGASTPYRATVFVNSAALDASSLKVAVFRLSGGRSVPVSDEVADKIEDAILTRARQIWIGERE